MSISNRTIRLALPHSISQLPIMDGQAWRTFGADSRPKVSTTVEAAAVKKDLG